MDLLFIEKSSKKEAGIERLQASFYIRFIYSWSYIIIGDEKGGDGDEDVSNQSYFV